jgi:hypothetical protein
MMVQECMSTCEVLFLDCGSVANDPMDVFVERATM